MCEPTTIITGISMVSSAVGAISDYAAQGDAYDANKAAAEKAAILQHHQLTLRQMQEQQASRQSIFQADLEARRTDAQARVMAGESGVAGASVDAVLEDIESKRLMNKHSIETNYENTAQQLGLERQGVEAQKQDRINSVEKPNIFATALRIGGDGLDAAGTYLRNKPSVAGGT